MSFIIYCPKCEWEPVSTDKWLCLCMYVWNTFKTRGQCPKCGILWRDTMCLRCKKWSEHQEWYHYKFPKSDRESEQVRGREFETV